MYRIIPVLVLIILVGQSSQDKIKFFKNGITIGSQKCQDAQRKHGDEIMGCVNDIYAETVKHMDSTGEDMAGNRKQACCGLKRAESCTSVLKVYF